MRVSERRLQGLLVAHAPERRPVRGLGALLGGILLAQHERVHFQGLGQLVERALNGEGPDRRPGRPIGGNLGPVGAHVVAHDVHVGDVVGRKGATHCAANGRAGERAGLQIVGGPDGGDPAVLGGADLDRARRAGRGAGGAEHLIARHHHLHRAAGLLGQDQRHRLQIDDGLAAEAAADLGRDGADVAQLDARQLGRHVAHHEVALAAAPDGDLARLVDTDEAGVGLDVALVHGLGLEAALDDDIGRGKPGVDVTQLVLELAGDVGHGGRTRLGADVALVLVQDGRARLHGLVDVDHPGQDLVVDLDQLQRLRRDPGRGRGDRRHGMPGVERLLARHDVAAVVAQVLDAQDRRLVPGELHEVEPGHDGLDARQRGRLLDVDRLDAGMRMGTAQDPADQHPRQRLVGAERCASGDLVHAVRPDRALANPLVVLAVRSPVGAVCRHRCSPPVALTAAWARHIGNRACPVPLVAHPTGKQSPDNCRARHAWSDRGTGGVGRANAVRARTRRTIHLEQPAMVCPGGGIAAACVRHTRWYGDSQTAGGSISRKARKRSFGIGLSKAATRLANGSWAEQRWQTNQGGKQ